MTKSQDNSIGKKIKLLREWAGFNQFDLAERAFQTRKAQRKVSRIEVYQEPKASELKQIAIALQVRCEDFFTNDLDPRLKERLNKTYPLKK